MALTLPLIILFVIHAILLAASATLHAIASRMAPSRMRRAYHIVASGISALTCVLAVAAIWYTFPTRYALAVGLAVSTYLFVWLFPAILTIRERKETLSAQEVVDVLHAVKDELES
jgi:hypothetical protein